MYIFSVFEHSDKIEEALTALQIKGVPKEQILAVPLEKDTGSQSVFDTTHYSDNESMLALPFIIATLGTMTGIVYGFQLAWGPIIWAVIGALSGMALGLVISLLKTALKKKKLKTSQKEIVVILVNCLATQIEMVQDILRSNAALGVGQLDR